MCSADFTCLVFTNALQEFSGIVNVYNNFLSHGPLPAATLWGPKGKGGERLGWLDSRMDPGI